MHPPNTASISGHHVSLRVIHLVFIGSSIVLAVLVTVWGIGMYASGRGSVGHLAFSGGALLSAAALSIYMVMFVRKTREIGME